MFVNRYWLLPFFTPRGRAGSVLTWRLGSQHMFHRSMISGSLLASLKRRFGFSARSGYDGSALFNTSRPYRCFGSGIGIPSLHFEHRRHLSLLNR